MTIRTAERAAALAAAVFLTSSAVVLGASNPGGDILQTFALNQLTPTEAADLLASACDTMAARCNVVPLTPHRRQDGAALFGHVNVTASPDVLESLARTLSEKDGPAPVREFRLDLVEASSSGSAQRIAEAGPLKEAFDALREILPFRSMRVVSWLVFRAGGEGRVSGNQFDAGSGRTYTVEMNVSGALDFQERLFIRDFKVKADDRVLIDSQFFVEFGAPLVVGASGLGSDGAALFVVLVASERPAASADPSQETPSGAGRTGAGTSRSEPPFSLRGP